MVEEQVLTHTQKIEVPAFQVDVISAVAPFLSLSEEWNRLIESAEVDLAFMSHTWFRTWWEAFGNGRQLHIVTVRAAGELVAIAPMMRTRTKMYGVRLNSLEAIHNAHSPRYDFIVSKKCGRDIYERIWHALATVDDCDLVVLKQVPEKSPTLPAVEGLARAGGWITGQWLPHPSPYIRLGCNYQEFFGRLKGGYRYNLRKRYEKLAKLGPIEVEVIQDKSAVREAMKDGLRIEAAAWKGDQGTAMISDPAVTEFYMRLAEREADLGHLRLSFLRLAGKRISFNYMLRNQKTLCGVKIGYDPEFHSYSPGNMHLNLILQEACGEGMEEYDFLGDNDEWKTDWTRDARGHRWLFLFKNHLWPKCLHYVKFNVVPRVKEHKQLAKLRKTVLGLRRGES